MSEWVPPSSILLPPEKADSFASSRPIDFHNLETYTARYTEEEYQRLARRERTTLRRHLEERANLNFQDLWDIIQRWKDPEEYHPISAERYEWIVMEALGVDVPPRDEGIPREPTDPEVHAAQELYRLSQCFLKLHFFDPRSPQKVELFRGIREKSVAKLVAQTIDNPNADRYEFITSTVANFTTLKGIGLHHASPVLITQLVPLDEVFATPDRLLHTHVNEDEFQVIGGRFEVDGRGVLLRGHHTDEIVELRTLIQAMDDPMEIPESYHREIADLVAMFESYGQFIRTREGKVRLTEWCREIESREILKPKQMRTLRNLVRKVTRRVKDDGKHRRTHK